MKERVRMSELLAPAGNMEALKAAIANGCDAIYLGMQRFGARAYSNNFDECSIREAVDYAHLRGVKIYVTMNTIVFEDEIEAMREQLHFLNEIGVDAVIVQDLAVFNYIVENFEDMEAHCSTQMGIDDLDGTLLFRELGAKRVVLARETDIETIKDIKSKAGIELEVFVHGALCVSYSGNCLMSGLIGYRSGNRGRCVGSCRKLYELINADTGESLGSSYILSTKDLNTFEHIEELKEIDSLKIEGRMKEPAYVANVVAQYRKAIDGTAGDSSYADLSRTFNRTYTEGYMFGEDKRDITNTDRPNNYGREIGIVSGKYKGMYCISLSESLNQNDIIRIDHSGEDVNLSVAKLYDRDGMLISGAEEQCYIKIKEELSAGDIVYKTKDYHFYKNLESELDGEYRRWPLNFSVYAYPESKLIINAEGLGVSYLYESEDVLSEAINNPTDKAQVMKQLNRLKDTIFELGELEFEEYRAFIPAKLLNQARREIVQGICDAKLASKERRCRTASAKKRICFDRMAPYLSASVMTKEQYDACVRNGIEEIYWNNVVRRNQNTYEDREGKLLIGGYGGIHHYRGSNPYVSDYSLNVVNAESVRTLHELGAERVTLSYELNRGQIRDLLRSYREANGGDPRLEMIVYGRAPLMFTKYCPLKKNGLCGECRKHQFVIRDEYGEFPIVSHEDCNTTILNGKTLNLLDEMPSIEGIEAFRLNFTLESADEVEEIIAVAKAKLNGTAEEAVFDQKTDTRGHYNKEII